LKKYVDAYIMYRKLWYLIFNVFLIFYLI
jgi:hypothetical protein